MILYKYFSIALFLFSFSSSSCSNFSDSLKKNDKNESEINLSPPRFEFQKDFHNFGDLVSGEIVSFSFIMENVGGESAYIQSVETNCGCLDVKWDKKPILRGAKQCVEVSFDSKGEWGKQLKVIQIVTSYGERIRLTISALVKNEAFEKYY